MSGFRKFGTSDDQKVDVDHEDEQGFSKAGLHKIATHSQDQEDEERLALLKETYEK
jgi:hypothetical protein